MAKKPPKRDQKSGSKRKAPAKKPKQPGAKGRGRIVSMIGSLAANFHEGSRSEYLAQYVFSSFGTAIPVPHQEDTGLDIYCTLLEQVGRRAWPRAYYSVQVKSTMDPWVFDSPGSVQWLIEHPLPIFLCIVQKPKARILVYHTTPRFAIWTMPTLPQRLEVRLGTEAQALTADWPWIGPCEIKAPILDFTIKQMLDPDFCAQVKKVRSSSGSTMTWKISFASNAASLVSRCHTITRRMRLRSLVV
jgi:hypothetical protein